MAVTQIPANWDHYFEWINMTPEEVKQQVAYWDAVAYSRQYGCPVPEVILDDPQMSAKPELFVVFTIGPGIYTFQCFAFVMNPTITVQELMNYGAIPKVYPIVPYYPPSHKPIPPKIDYTNLVASVGDILVGYVPQSRELKAPYQGHVALGSKVIYTDGNYTLTQTSPFNQTGVWQIDT